MLQVVPKITKQLFLNVLDINPKHIPHFRDILYDPDYHQIAVLTQSYHFDKLTFRSINDVLFANRLFGFCREYEDSHHAIFLFYAPHNMRDVMTSRSDLFIAEWCRRNFKAK